MYDLHRQGQAFYWFHCSYCTESILISFWKCTPLPARPSCQLEKSSLVGSCPKVVPTVHYNYETRRFNAVLTRDLQKSLILVLIITTSHINIYFLYIDSSIFRKIHLRLPIWLRTRDVSIKMLKALLPSTILATCLVYLNFLHLITMTI